MSPPAQKALSLLLRMTTASTASSSRHACRLAASARTIASDSELRVRGRLRMMVPVRWAMLVWTCSLIGRDAHELADRHFSAWRCEKGATRAPSRTAGWAGLRGGRHLGFSQVLDGLVIMV